MTDLPLLCRHINFLSIDLTMQGMRWLSSLSKWSFVGYAICALDSSFSHIASSWNVIVESPSYRASLVSKFVGYRSLNILAACMSTNWNYSFFNNKLSFLMTHDFWKSLNIDINAICVFTGGRNKKSNIGKYEIILKMLRINCIQWNVITLDKYEKWLYRRLK